MSLEEEWASAKPASDLSAEWAGAVPARKTPKQMKIGAEGFPEAMRSVLEESPIAGRLAAAASFPRQLYEGAKQFAGELMPQRPTLSGLVAPQARQAGDPTTIQALRTMQETYPGAAVAGGVASMIPLSAIPGANTIAGQAALGAATGALMPTQAGESRAVNALTGGLAGGATAGVLKAAAPLAQRVLGAATGKVAQETMDKAVRDATLAEGRAAGYVIPRTATGTGGALEKFVESTSGRGALNREASVRNQAVTNRIARVEAGLRPDEPMSEAALSAARERLAEPYREVSAISARAKDALERLKDARLDVKDASKKYFGPFGGSEERKILEAAESRVSTLERLIEKEATKAGSPDLMKRLREARMAIAKNHDVESALNIGGGRIDAKVIAKILDRRGSKAVTGGLQTIGKMAQAFPDFMREPPSGQLAAGVSAVRPYATAAALALGSENEKARSYGVSPYMLGLAGLSALGGPARNIALSRLMQRAPTYAPGLLPRATAAATGSPLLPAAATGGALTLQQLMQQQP